MARRMARRGGRGGRGAAHGLQPHPRPTTAPTTRASCPDVAAYEAAVGRFLARYPWVHVITPWNEPNHHGEPTFRDARGGGGVLRRGPASLSGVHDRRRRRAGHRQHARAGWPRTGRAARGRPWSGGLHNYHDTTHQLADGLESFLHAVSGRRLAHRDGWHRRAAQQQRTCVASPTTSSGRRTASRMRSHSPVRMRRALVACTSTTGRTSRAGTSRRTPRPVGTGASGLPGVPRRARRLAATAGPAVTVIDHRRGPGAAGGEDRPNDP